MYNSHLTLEERRIILKGIENGSSKAAIASTIGKEKSTVGKEIKLHRTLTYKCSLPLECSNYKKCSYGRKCTKDCPDYIPFKCTRRDRSPGACNGCKEWRSCRFDKYKYIPESAQKEYEETRSDFRKGVNLTYSEAEKMASVIKPLLDKKQSPYTIIHNHPELGITERTLYSYIEDGVFHEVAGITAMDLRRQVSRKIPKDKKAQFKKRQNRKFLEGRTHRDFVDYTLQNPDVFVTMMDTVYNDGSNGPFLQTFKFCGPDIFFSIYHEEKTAQSMLNGIILLEDILGKDLFRKYCHVILTDRGSEFTAAEEMETDSDGTRRCRVFYCDPMRADQKASLENNHIVLRYFFPKESDMKALGLTGQNPLNLVLSHMNSMPVEKQNGKSPFEIAEFIYPDLFGKLIEYGLTPIEKDDVTLTSDILK